MAKKPLRKLLPKDLDAQLEAAAKSGDYGSVQVALEACEPNATGGSAKATLLAKGACPPELARWAIARGTDVNFADQYGKTALHSSAGAPFHFQLRPEILLELGADPKARDRGGLTPLHCAAGSAHVHAAEVLIAAGVEVDARSERDQTPLEYGLERAHNAKLPELLAMVRVLIAAGAAITDAAKKHMQRVSETFEFHRARYDPKTVDRAAAAHDALCELLGVSPAPRRRMHDGRSPIIATAATWQKQHAELWDLLVPSSGACATVQGELVRIAGRIGDEIARNAGGNWDRDYRAMATAFLAHVASHQPLPAELATSCADVVARLPDLDADHAVLARAAVAWVALNPDPVPLPPPAYKR